MIPLAIPKPDLSVSRDAGLREVRRITDFAQIRDFETDAVVWDRTLPSFVSTTLNTAHTEQIRAARLELLASNVGAAMSELLEEFTPSQPDGCAWLVNDVAQLARTYAHAAAVNRVVLRVEWVSDDACRKFHRDMVKARMICTYRGPGTQIASIDDAGTPQDIETLATGRAVLLKGKLWPISPPRTLLHRSPPIEGTGQTRLVIVINEAR